MRLLRHLLAAVRRGRLDDEMREELAQHVTSKTQQLIEEGVEPGEARRRAALTVGNVSRLREDARAVWGFPSADSVIQDLRYGVRQLVRAPMFSAIAILSLAIGIGAGAAVFGLADAVLFRTLPAVKDPASLYVLRWTSGPVFPFSSLNGYGDQNADGLASTSFPLSTYRETRAAAAGTMDVLGFADLDEVNVAIDGRAEIARAHAVS